VALATCVALEWKEVCCRLDGAPSRFRKTKLFNQRHSWVNAILEKKQQGIFF
jgi:hypothetical protein